MNKVTIALTSCAFALAIGSVASAAPTTSTPDQPFSVSIGAYLPTNASAKNAGGNTQFTAGIDYAFNKETATTPYALKAYGDYFGGSKNGGSVKTGGIGIAVQAPLTSGQSASESAPYVGAGVGVYRNVKTNVGGKVFVGYTFQQSLFVEASYTFLQKSQGVDPSGIGLSVGTHF